MLRITILSENTAVRPDLAAEDGLSVFIETDRHKILMDAGWNGVFLSNAEKLGVPVEEADTAVLSHDHYDHGQSFPLFFERMAGRRYLFYLSSDVLWPGYHRRPDGTLTSTGCGLSDAERLGRPVTAVLGGTHLKASGPERAMDTIRFFNDRPALKTAAVCHCTGAPALQLFSEHCKAYTPCGAGTVLEWR